MRYKSLFVAVGFISLFAFPSTAQAVCVEPPTPITFDHITEVPYGDPPSERLDVVFREPPEIPFITDSYLLQVEFNPGDGPPPWDLDECYWCDVTCRVQTDADPEDDWEVNNQCPNLYDESQCDETDWWVTQYPSVGGYNCFAYTLDRQDVSVEQVCDPEARSLDSFPALDALYQQWGYSRSAHCFPECGVRKVAGFGGWQPAAGRIVTTHGAVEVGDDGWWESKFGQDARILHRLFDLSGGCFVYSGVLGCWEREDAAANLDLCDPEYDPLEDPANEVPAELCDRWGAENFLFCHDEFCEAWGEEACDDDDEDLDGIEDALDSCPDIPDLGIDSDGDSIDDACDNCTDVANPRQENCDPDWDADNPAGLRGDACDPDPCADYRYPHYLPWRGRRAVTDGVEQSLLTIPFGTHGGEMDAGTFTYPAGGDEKAVDVQAAYCSCAQDGVAGCGALECLENGALVGNIVTGRGWFNMTRREDAGAGTKENLPDVRFTKMGAEAEVPWVFEGDDCPGAGGLAVDCGTLFPQEFRLWLRPMVEAAWPTTWIAEEHNFYTTDDFSTHPIPIISVPPELIGEEERRLVPEMDCIACDLFVFGDDVIPWVGELVPDDPESPFYFEGAGPGDPTQGVAIGLVDPTTFAVVGYVPSEGVTPSDEPRVTGFAAALVPGSGTSGDAEIWLFGGVDAAGESTNGLWRGVTATGPDRVIWEKLLPAGTLPEGRQGAVLAYDRLNDTIAMIGGTDALGNALSDAWRFDLATAEWSTTVLYRSPDDAALGSRGYVAHAQRGESLYLYGGERIDGTLISDLNLVDLATGHIRHIPFDVSLPAPGARAESGLVVEADGRGLLLYGGSDALGPASDLWRFDLDSRAWDRIGVPCSSGPCPSAGAATMIAGSAPGTVAVFGQTAGEIRPEPLWSFDIADAVGPPSWTGYRALLAAGNENDCNGNGSPDPGVGVLCSTSASWYSAPDAKGCTTAGSVACPALAPTAASTNQVAVGASPAFAARGSTVVLASGTSLKRLRLQPGSAPTTVATKTLAGSGVKGVVVDGRYAFVGTSAGIEVFSLAGGGLTSAGIRTVSGTLRGLAGDGQRLHVVSGQTLYVLNSSLATLPQLGSLTLPTGTPAGVAVTGHRMAVGVGNSVAVVAISQTSVPSLVGTVSVGGATLALRGSGRYAYGVRTSGATYVIDVGAATPTNVGTHDVAEWTKGATWVPRFALRISGSSLWVVELR